MARGCAGPLSALGGAAKCSNVVKIGFPDSDYPKLSADNTVLYKSNLKSAKITTVLYTWPNGFTHVVIQAMRALCPTPNALPVQTTFS